MTFLIIGLGSIGTKHLKNLKALGYDKIFVYDADKNQAKKIAVEFGVKAVANLEEVLESKVNGVFVCTPPATHLQLAVKVLEHNKPVFIEKPLSNNLANVSTLLKLVAAKKLPVLVGYNLRFHPVLKFVKTVLQTGKIGKVLDIHVEYGQYLPDWRPLQDYRLSYTTSASQGGIILDGSHEIDYVCWLMGKPKAVFCWAAKRSQLKVEAEDTADILLHFHDRSVATIHLDFVQRAYVREGRAFGEKGTIKWDIKAGKTEIYTADDKKWQTHYFEKDLNVMYLEELKHFLKCIQNKEKPAVTVPEAVGILKIVLAAKQSASKNEVQLDF